MYRKYDLVILDGAFPDCGYGFVDQFKAPFMIINTVGYYVGRISQSGSPAPISVTPVFYWGHTDNMSFVQRIHNLFLQLVVDVMHQVC